VGISLGGATLVLLVLAALATTAWLRRRRVHAGQVVEISQRQEDGQVAITHLRYCLGADGKRTVLGAGSLPR
jgi:hypothetical protein